MSERPRSRIALFALAIAVGLTGPAIGGDETTTFEHDRLSLSLPPGWSTGEIPVGSGKEVIGFLDSDSIPGATITVVCRNGFGVNYSSTRISGLKTLAAIFPLGQEMLQEPTKIKTDAKKTARVEFWRGMLPHEDGALTLQAQLGIAKTKGCWALLIGVAPESSDDRVREEFTRIVQSAQ